MIRGIFAAPLLATPAVADPDGYGQMDGWGYGYGVGIGASSEATYRALAKLSQEGRVIRHRRGVFRIAPSA